MKNIFSISALIIAISLGYYFVIFLPNKEQIKQQEKVQAGMSSKLIQKQREQCLEDASHNDVQNWISYCQSTGQIATIDTKNIPLDRFEISPDGQFKTDKQTGVSYSLEEGWILDVKNDKWLPNIDRIKACRLPDETVDRIDNKTKDAKDECYLKYPK